MNHNTNPSPCLRHTPKYISKLYWPKNHHYFRIQKRHMMVSVSNKTMARVHMRQYDRNVKRKHWKYVQNIFVLVASFSTPLEASQRKTLNDNSTCFRQVGHVKHFPPPCCGWLSQQGAQTQTCPHGTNALDGLASLQITQRALVNSRLKRSFSFTKAQLVSSCSWINKLQLTSVCAASLMSRLACQLQKHLHQSNQTD